MVDDAVGADEKVPDQDPVSGYPKRQRLPGSTEASMNAWNISFHD